MRSAALKTSMSRTTRSSKSRAIRIPRFPVAVFARSSASEQLINSAGRQTKVLHRAPYATEWTELELDEAIDMIADRVLEARDKGWQDVDEEGRKLNRTMGFAGLGGAVLDNEENYLIKKLYTNLGAVQIENVARI